MKEYIYRESATKDGVITKIKMSEIVRCNNCTYFVDKDDGITKHRCVYHNHGVNPEDFCSYGNRKLSN